MIDEVKDIEATESEEKTEVIAESEPERVIVFEEAIEAILFAAGHPISYATLARVFDTTPAKIKEKVMDYAEKYNSQELPRGVILLTYADACQLSTKKYYLPEIRDALGIRKNGTLSTSSMEALAIVAYNQPVTRFFVDTLRRADSSYAMNNLLDRGLIEMKGRLDAPGRPMLYGTTHDFLRVFGLKSIEELPRTAEEIQDMFAKASNIEIKQEEIQFPEGTFDNVTTESVEETTIDTVLNIPNIEADATSVDVEDGYEELSAEDTVIED
jgi:segregation and condensation protein B